MSLCPLQVLVPSRTAWKSTGRWVKPAKSHVKIDDGVGVGVSVGADVGVGVGVRDGVDSGIGVNVGVGSGVRAGVGVTVGVGVPAGTGVGPGWAQAASNQPPMTMIASQRCRMGA